tara:strand:- start:828 stop:2720 length:1893 start_codon:yes stop_codon:yes gene_type:complete
MTTNQIPNPKMQFFTAAGIPLVGGKLYSYAAGTTTPLSTYTDSTGGTANTNPVILDSRGEASVWFASAQYYLVLKDANDVQIWTADNVNGVNQPTVDYLTSTGGASLISYAPSGYGAVTTNVQAKLRQYVSVFDFMTTAQINDVQTAAGVLDVAAVIMTATTACVTAGKTLFFPAGTYTCTTITAQARMKWVGESSITTIIKLKNGTNANLVNCLTYTIDDASIECMKFDGNRAGNTSGNVILLYGNRTRMDDVTIVNAPQDGVITNHDPSGAARLGGIEGYFNEISIDTCGGSGWVHYGPNDSHFNKIIIVDTSLTTSLANYGMFLGTSSRTEIIGGIPTLVTTNGNGRFNDLHTWNRGNTTNYPSAGVYVATGGNNFTNCHFECGNSCLAIAGNINTFAACDYYAPDGGAAIYLTGGTNNVSGTVWHYSGLQPYVGIALLGFGNVINLTCDGGNPTSAFTAIQFSDAIGYNNVTMAGYLGAAATLYSGTPNATDIVNITATGPNGAVLIQTIPNSWTAYTPSITAGTGTITTSSSTGRYIKTSKTVNIQMSITITTNGTGSISVIASLPYQASPFEFVLAGRNTTTGKMLQAEIIPGANYIRIFNYDNSYPINVNGEILHISGIYEAL